MGKPFLSQEEVDALLGAATNKSDILQTLSTEEQDVLSEIGNINAGSASTALSELLNQRVYMNTPTLSFTTLKELHQKFNTPYLFIEVEYLSGLNGNNIFILKSEDAAIIANLMMGGNGQNCSPEMDEINLSAVSEAMNQMIGFSATSMSEMFNTIIEISPPKIKLIDTQMDDEQFEMNPCQEIVVISFQLQIGDILQSQIMLVMNIDIAQQQVQYLIKDNSKDFVNITPDSEDNYNNSIMLPRIQVQDIGVDNNILQNNSNLNLILDVPLRLSVLLGRTKKSIGDVLRLTQGSIVELERIEGEPVDILVNDILIARGEVVVVKEYFGVRITDIISTENRLKNLVQK
jgi:flagellar motor switch protein FliN/FliY